MKRTIYSSLLLGMLISVTSCNQPNDQKEQENAYSGATKTQTVHYPEETHFKTITQLTNGGDNAEAYFSFNNKYLVFQANNEKWGTSCDQIFYMPVDAQFMDSTRAPLLSTGKGRTTCAYFLPGDSTIVYASTHLNNDACPPVPAKRADKKYVWPIYSGYDIFVSDLNGKILKQLTNNPGYDAEATVSPKGDKIVFTSMRSGDLELYTMDINGNNVKQITNELGYDGGAFFSPDGSQIIFRASRPTTEEDIKTYKDLLAQGLVMPTEMELFICNADGSDIRQLTKLGNANWAPFFHPSGKKVIFSSNHASDKSYPFNLYMINTDGTGLERITFDSVFDAFPMFSFDGKKLIFASNRNNGGGRSTNLFLAEWQD